MASQLSPDLDDIAKRGARLPLLRLAGSLIAVALLVYLLSQQGWAEIGAALRQIPAWRLGLALGLTLISRCAVVGRWYVLLRAAETPISLAQSTQITFAGLFASNFLPTTVGGDVVRLAGGLRLGCNRAICLASLVVDRLIGMAGMGMAALTLLGDLPALVQQVRSLVSRAGNEGCAHSNNHLPVLAGIFSGLAAKMTRLLRRFGDALGVWLQRPQALLVSLGFTWVHMLCVFGSIWLLLPGLGESLHFWRVAGLWALTYFITLLPISINGLGVQELSTTFLFTTFGGIADRSGLTLALLVRILPMFASLPGALFIPAIMAGRSGTKLSR